MRDSAVRHWFEGLKRLVSASSNVPPVRQAARADYSSLVAQTIRTPAGRAVAWATTRNLKSLYPCPWIESHPVRTSVPPL